MRFALIIDEAHSSQSGESTKSLKAVLSPGSLEDAEREESAAETPEEEINSAILAEMEKRGPLRLRHCPYRMRERARGQSDSWSASDRLRIL